jgi:hypothetical protein
MLIEGPRVKLYSYVVRYDSGFAPNPFYGVCTLATCKPDIRKAAKKNDWVIGTGSACKEIKHGGFLVYAMRVTEILSFDEYWFDRRFQLKKPSLLGSKKQACGDNIYHRITELGSWEQLDSFHSEQTGAPSAGHIKRDTGVDRVLASSDFRYFGGHGPLIPRTFRNYRGVDICKHGRGKKVFDTAAMIDGFVAWLRTASPPGYASDPLDWAMIP